MSTPIQTRRTLNVREVAEIMGVSPGKIYEAVRTGDIPSLKFGSRIVIARSAIQRLLNEPASEES